ncbi:hypothetical protein EB835_18750 [Brevibacterium sp. S22]|nr:hypothetical protein EB835_18750 [Brevibacterium sp. S22]
MEHRIAQVLPTVVAMTATMLVTYPMFANSVGLLTTILAAFVTYFGMHCLTTRLVGRVIARNRRLPH